MFYETTHHFPFFMNKNCGRGPGHFGGRGGFLARFAGGFMGGGPRGGGMRAARMLASGDLQLIILALLKEKPRHGYDIIKALEEHSSGVYAPSPGVVYPALTYLEEMGYAASEAEGNKKLYTITEAGAKHLEENRELVDETMDQLARFGRKMAQFQKHFSDETAANEDSQFEEEDMPPRYRAKQEWRQMKSDLRELRDELKAAIWDKFDASAEERTRILGILKKAIAEIRGDKPQ